MLAAAALHAVALGTLMTFGMQAPVATSKSGAIAVTLVWPPDPIPGPVTEATAALAGPEPGDGAASEPSPAAPSPARPPATNAAPFPHAAAAKEPRLPAARPKAPPAARANVAAPAARAPAPAPSAASAMVYAVYEVLVGAGGVAESIVVAQSSGTPRFDEAGASMIRGTMTFEPPAATRRSVTSVIVRFFPEQR